MLEVEGNSPLGVGLPHVAWVFPRNMSMRRIADRRPERHVVESYCCTVPGSRSTSNGAKLDYRGVLRSYTANTATSLDLDSGSAFVSQGSVLS